MVSLHNNNSFGIDTERCFFLRTNVYHQNLVVHLTFLYRKYKTFDIHAKPTLAARDD